MKETFTQRWERRFAKCRWVVKELIKCASGHPSYFSMKRIQSIIAFTISQHGALYTLITIVKTAEDFAIWFTLEAAVAGYTLNQVQKEKKLTLETEKQNGTE